MMSIQTQLFNGQHICLAPIDHEKDAEIQARWTNDPDYLRAVYPEPVRPKSVAQMKKKLEAIEKEVEEDKNQFYFTLRLRSDDRLIGFAQIYWIEWSHGNGWLRLAIGDAQDRGRGYGTDALHLLMNYAFNELNLHRLTAVVMEDNPRALKFFLANGFIQEVRRRQAIQRDDRRWDVIHLGLLKSEWQAYSGDTK